MPHVTPPPSPARAEPVDLLLVGALTIDRLADGSSQPGGAVLHAARAARAAGWRVGVISVAGPEPVARAGIDELRAVSEFTVVVDARQTLTFRHRETAAVRRLWLERSPAARVPQARPPRPARAVLLAPVFDELVDTSLDRWAGSLRGACLQGWLRRTEIDGAVTPVDPRSLPEGTVRSLATFDALFVSQEDVASPGDDPHGQLDALRARFGPGPLLVLTVGEDGVWLDVDRGARAEPARWQIGVPARVDNVATTGAGDAFAALFLASYNGVPGHDNVTDAAVQAMDGVVEMLQARRR